LYKTYVLIVNDDALTISSINSVRGADPSLPECTVNPGEAYFFAPSVVHIDTNSLGSPERSLVISVLCLLNAHLLRVTELLALQLEFLDLSIHPFIGGALHFSESAVESHLILVVQNTENNNLAVHDLARIGGGELRDEWQPDRLHPVEHTMNISYLVRRERSEVCWAALSRDQQSWEGANLEAVIQFRVIRLDELGVSNQAEWQPFQGQEIFGSGSMVVEVYENDLLFLLHCLESCGIDIRDTAGQIDSFLGVLDEVTKPSKATILSTLATLEEENGRIRLGLDVFAKTSLLVAVDLSNVKLALQGFSQLVPGRSESLAMRAPRGVKLDEPGILGHGDEFLEALGGQWYGKTIRIWWR
jgi:hypothetical protein